MSGLLGQLSFIGRIATSFILAIATFSAFSAPAHADDSLQRIESAKVLKVGVALNAPWVIKKSDGTYAGNDIDLVAAMAQDLGVKVVYVEMPFANLIQAVARGDVDMAAAGIAITPERARFVAFSAPTGLQRITTVADRKALGTDAGAAMAKPEFKIAALRGSTDEAAARIAWPKATVVAYPSAAEALAALIDGNAQAMVATEPAPRMAASLYDAKLRPVGGTLQQTAEAFALRPDDVRLLIYVNNWIAAREADGFINNVGAHWFDGQHWLSTLEPQARPKAAGQ